MVKLSLFIEREGRELDDLDERKEILNRINHPSVHDEFLSKLLVNNEVDEIRLLWFLIFKDKMMYKVSLICPELKFRLEGKEEDDEWSEVWVNGRRIESNNLNDLSNYIFNKLKEEHPQIYEGYVRQKYQGDIYDDQEITYNGLQLENTMWQEDPEFVPEENRRYMSNDIPSPIIMLFPKKTFDQSIGRILRRTEEPVIINII